MKVENGIHFDWFFRVELRFTKVLSYLFFFGSLIFDSSIEKL